MVQASNPWSRPQIHGPGLISSIQYPVSSIQNPEVSTQNPEVSTQNPEVNGLMEPGQWFNGARTVVYGARTVVYGRVYRNTACAYGRLTTFHGISLILRHLEPCIQSPMVMNLLGQTDLNMNR